MRVYLFILVTFLVFTFTLDTVTAKSKQKNVETKSVKGSKKTEAATQEEEKPAFEKARIRYTKPKTDTRVKKETNKQQNVKKTKSADVTREAKNKYKQPEDQAQPAKRSKKQEKYVRSANGNEKLVPDTKKAKDKRTKRDATVLEKEKVKKVQREEVGVEEVSEEVCPPCDCSRGHIIESLSNNAEEDVTTVETETEEVTEEETEENLQCDSLVDGCDI